MGFRPLPGHLISKLEPVGLPEFLGKAFPSPSGASHFQIRLSWQRYTEQHQSFRPLPGHLISKSICRTLPADERVFPSPSGASHFQINPNFEPIIGEFYRFRPLPGHLISKSILRRILRFRPLRFRPLPGHLISKWYADNFMLYESFRPLPGHLISKFYMHSIQPKESKPRFRPLPGHLISKSKHTFLKTISRRVFPSPSGASHFQIQYWT